jgi:predicted HTH transcriptional regulator
MKASTQAALDKYIAASNFVPRVPEGVGFTASDVAARTGISRKTASERLVTDKKAGKVKCLGKRGREDVYDNV